jgi:hypothetical protein
MISQMAQGGIIDFTHVTALDCSDLLTTSRLRELQMATREDLQR